jgi:tetratricopeptide (TPR) repeat protein
MGIRIGVVALITGFFALSGVALADPGVEREIATVSAALRAAPQDATLLVQRADLQRRVGRFEQALSDLALAEAMTEDLGPVYLVRARVLRDRGEEASALRLLESSLDHTSSAARAEAYGMVADIHEEAGRVDEAILAYDASLSLRDDVTLYLARGRLLAFSGRLDEAIAGYETGVDALAGAAVLRAQLATLLIAANELERALGHADALVAQAQAKSQWLLLRARVHEAMRRADLAARDRRAALTDAERVLSRRGSATARLARARALIALGRVDEAVVDLGHVVRRAPQLAEARVLLHRYAAGGAR